MFCFGEGRIQLPMQVGIVQQLQQVLLSTGEVDPTLTSPQGGNAIKLYIQGAGQEGPALSTDPYESHSEGNQEDSANSDPKNCKNSFSGGESRKFI